MQNDVARVVVTSPFAAVYGGRSSPTAVHPPTWTAAAGSTPGPRAAVSNAYNVMPDGARVATAMAAPRNKPPAPASLPVASGRAPVYSGLANGWTGGLLGPPVPIRPPASTSPLNKAAPGAVESSYQEAHAKLSHLTIGAGGTANDVAAPVPLPPIGRVLNEFAYFTAYAPQPPAPRSPCGVGLTTAVLPL